MKDVLLITTYDVRSGREAEFQRMLASVKLAATGGIRIRHLILLQHCDPTYNVEENPWTDFIRMEGRVSLAQARNILLNHAYSNRYLEDTRWVAFPDDDAWYPAGFLEHLSSLFESDADLDLVICQYCSQPRSFAEEPALKGLFRAPSGQEFVLNAQSNTMFLSASLVQCIKFFDELLGVGGPVNGGEDLDFALRGYIAALRRNKKVRWFSAPLVGHRDKVIILLSRYYPGSLYALIRSARHNPAVALQVLRKLAVGVALILKREMTVKQFLSDCLIGLRGWREQSPLVNPAFLR